MVAAVAAVVGGLLVETAPSYAAQGVTNSLYDNWEQPVPSTDVIDLPAVADAHAETSAVYYNNQWQMFHRRRARYENDPERYVISRSVSSDGTHWIFDRDVIWPELFPDACYSVEAPKVLVQPGLLTMVFEANPYESSAPSGCPWREYKTVVAMAHSTDGQTWTNFRTILKAASTWEGSANGGDGRDVGNIGTPTVTQGHDNKIYVGYHGFNGTKIGRGAAVYNTLNPQLIGTTISWASRAQSQFKKQNGNSPENRAMFAAGFGAGDIIRWAPESGGVSDEKYYLVVEGFSVSPLCFSQSEITIAIARATYPNGPWAVQDQVLVAPHRGDGNVQCGADMPSWQFDRNDLRYKVILTNLSRSGVQRISLRNTYVPVPPPPPVTTRWQLRSSNTAGGADFGFDYGEAGDYPLVCDWDNNGTATPAVVRGNTFYIKNSWSGPPTADYTVSFGNGYPQDVPVCGDWNGDGYDTIGVMRDVTGDARWYLNDAGQYTPGGVTEFFFGETRGPHYDRPIVGDWNGDGLTDVGVQRQNQTVSRFILASGRWGSVYRDYLWGDLYDVAISGRWTGAANDGLGLYRPSSGFFYLDPALDAVADIGFQMSGAGPAYAPVGGNFDGFGGASVGVFRKQ